MVAMATDDTIVVVCVVVIDDVMTAVETTMAATEDVGEVRVVKKVGEVLAGTDSRVLVTSSVQGTAD